MSEQKKIDKKTLDAEITNALTDEFDRFEHFAVTNWKLIAWISVLIVVGVAVVCSVIAWRESADIEAASALSNADSVEAINKALKEYPDHKADISARLRLAGIYFGKKVDEQLIVLKSSKENLKKVLTTVRFRATENIYRFLREELKRYPINQIRFAKNSSAVFNDRWKDPGTGNFNLEIIKDDTHPYPIEIDLPKWTVQEDIDFRRWLLGFREGIIIESPKEFVEEIKSNISKLGEIYKTKKN